VVEISGRREPKLLPDMNGGSTTVHGEAVTVDLPNGRTIFGLLKGVNSAGYAERIALNLLTPAERASMPELEAGKILGAVQRTVELPRSAYPLIVTFRNPADPQSVEGVDPDSTTQLGPGTHLRRITIRTTRKPVTRRIEERLPISSIRTRLHVTAPDGVRHTLFAEHFKR
jgi:hypothetical protein